MPQTNYGDISEAGLIAGQLFISVVNGAKLTGYNTGTTVLPAGYGAVWGEGKAVSLPSGAGSFAGILTIPQVEMRTGYSLTAGGLFGWPAKYEVALAVSDMYAVYVDGTVAVGDSAFLNHTASTSVVGTFRAAANSGNAQQIAGAKFMSAAVGTPGTPALAIVNLSAN
jgi:hypothetical protein